jgi:undecaprenyl diphosphate synthase
VKKNFYKFLYNPLLPDPEIIIRTGGDLRISNFLLWQSAYSELFFTKTLWPNFNFTKLNKIISDFNKRKRNFGK